MKTALACEARAEAGTKSSEPLLRHPPASAQAPSFHQSFAARCDAAAMLVGAGAEDLADCVDRLQHDARRAGLVKQLGQDGVQAIMARAFERWRR